MFKNNKAKVTMVIAPQSNSSTIQDEQLMELFRRSRVSVLFSIPALITVAAVHSNSVHLSSLCLWLFGMLGIQSIRFGIAQINLTAPVGQKNNRLWHNLEMICSVAAGSGWGAMLFMLDTGKLDFIFLFKFASIAAALGVTMNALSAVLSVYLSFIIPTAILIWTYLLTQASFLQTSDKITLSIGTAVYVSVLFFVGRHVNKLTRISLEQRFERESALRRLEESHEQEIALRTRLERESEQLAELNVRLHDLARLDPLTGLFNRRHLMEQLTRELNASQRYSSTFSVILFDIDDFKQINDVYGHQAGDRVLIGLARLISNELREIDLLARWGGEEFLCLLPKASKDEAKICGERLRQSLENARLIDDNPDQKVTASFGIAIYQSGDDADLIVKRADESLYAAKTAGKNRVFCGSASEDDLFAG